MAQPYIGEIRIFAGNFAPADWMFCQGQVLPIAGNDNLFQLIGTTYGGDGQSNFALPDLRGRLPMHQGGGFVQAETGGAEEVTVTIAQTPAHTHSLMASASIGTTGNPANAVPAQSPSIALYESDVPGAGLNAVAISPIGGSQPHENFQPYLCLNFIISFSGIYPSPT